MNNGTLFCWVIALAVTMLPSILRAAPKAPATSYAPWGNPVKGFVEPKAEEHPRLLFRKADIPALRAKAQTPVGQKIVARMRELLGNDGEKLPRFDNVFPLNATMQRTRRGHFTIGHPPAYGMLYILTGEKKYAELARTCLERMFDEKLYVSTMLAVKKAAGPDWTEPGVVANLQKLGLAGKTDQELETIPFTYGQGDMDPRLNWTRPGTGMRPGPLLLCVALTYDLCYDAWDADFRARVAREIFTYNKPETFFQRYTRAKNIDLEQLVEGDNYIVQSNHYGYTLGGVGVALLALRNDPGIDMQRLDRLLGRVEVNLAKLLNEGHGDRGYFAEGFGCGEISSNPTLLTFLQAARVSWGKDFITPSLNAQWLTLKWPMCIVPGPKGEPNYYHVGGPGAYTRYRLESAHFSQGGEFAHGFGALADDKQQAALLWVYDHTFGQSDRGNTFNEDWYPHRMISALVNWPTDLQPLNPGEVIPHAVVDQRHGYYQFRNRWQDTDDCFVAFLLNPDLRHGWIKGSPRGGVLAVHGLGASFLIGNYRLGTRESSFQSDKDGSSILTMRHEKGDVSALAVDFTGRPGVPAVIVFANPWPSEQADAKTTWMAKTSAATGNNGATVSRVWIDEFAGGTLLLTVGRGELPKPMADKETLKLGGQTYKWDGKTIAMSQGQ